MVLDLFIRYRVWDVVCTEFTDEERNEITNAKATYLDDGVVVHSEAISLQTAIKLAQFLLEHDARILPNSPLRKKSNSTSA